LKTTENTFLKDVDAVYWRQTSHFVEKFKSVELENEPFVHFEQHGLFSDEFYSYIKNIFNDIDDHDLPTIVETSLVPKAYPKERKILPIKNFHEGHKLMETYVKSAEKKNQYFKLYKWLRLVLAPMLLKKYGIDEKSITHDELLYVHDETGYELKPHTDVREKIVSVLIYLPDDDSISHAGTNILVPKEKGFKSFENVIINENKFNIYKTAKFIPNNIFSFVRSDCSFHSVSKLISDTPRKLLLLTLANQNIDKD
jgi:hypothetical protein